jgi:hypothetical protein
VLAHDGGGAVLIAVGDRLDQAGVLVPGVLASHLGDRRVVPADASVDLRGETDEELVVGHLRDQAMQLGVRAHGLVDIAGGQKLFATAAELAQLRDRLR